MPSKPYADDQNRQQAVAAHAPLSRFEVIEATGPDIADFLQRQTMNDIRRLDVVGRWQWNGLLSPKGRVHQAA